MKQDGKYRQEYFRDLMNKWSITALRFQWFVTHDLINTIIFLLLQKWSYYKRTSINTVAYLN